MLLGWNWSSFVLALCLGLLQHMPAIQANEMNKVVTLPLIPHRVQLARRNLSRDLSALEDEREVEELRRRYPRRRRQLQQAPPAQQVGGLYQGYGTHYVDLWCGSPPQRQTVIVDTGSGITAFPCKDCKRCGASQYHTDGLFTEDLSSSFRKLDCDTCDAGTCQEAQDWCKIRMSYQEGSSWTAYEAIDKCYIGGPHHVPLTEDQGTDDLDPAHASHFAFDLTFGCQTALTGLFITQLADGIMGMDFESTSYWSQMFQADKMGSKKQFSLCYSRPPHISRDGTEAGAMSLGGVDPRLHSSAMVYSSGADRDDGWFSVTVQAVYLRAGSGGESAASANPDAQVIKLDIGTDKLNRGGVIVDSGTTDTYWDRSLAVAFAPVFRQLANRPFNNNGWTMTQAQVEALPTILIQIKGDEAANKGLDTNTAGLAGDLDPDNPYDVLLAFPPTHYMEYDSRKRKYVPRFYMTEDDGSVVGANVMMGHDVLFDVDNARLGWAESSCDYGKILHDNGFQSALEWTQSENGATTVSPEVSTTESAPESTTTESASTPVSTEETTTTTSIGDETTTESASTSEQETTTDIPNPTTTVISTSSIEPTTTQTATSTTSETDIVTTTVAPSKTKKPPPEAGNSTHDQHVPTDDVKKSGSALTFFESCSSLTCRLGSAAAVLASLLLGAFMGKCLCFSQKGKADEVRYHRANIEMSSPNGFPGYRDDPDDDDAEYGTLS